MGEPSEEDHQLYKQVSGLDSGQVTTWTSWHRWTAVGLLAGAFLAVAAACQRAADSSAGILELIPVTAPELLRQLRGIVIPEPRRDKQHRDAWAYRGEHQGAVEPGATYGPSPFVQRAIHPALFTGSLLIALRGELKREVRP